MSTNRALTIYIRGNTEALAKSLTSSRLLIAGFGAAMASLSTGAVVAFNNFKAFEATFSNAVTLLDQTSFKTKSFEQGVSDLKDGILALRAETGQSFETLNKGLFDLISAGVDAEKAIDSLRVSTNLAVAGATETGIAVDGITSAMNAYGREAGTAQEVAEKFYTAQKGGKTTVQELAENFGSAGASAAAFGISLDELLASTAAATTGGIRTNAAMTGLNAVISNIAHPTAEAAAEAERLGVEFNSMSLRTKGLKGFLDELTASTKFNETSLEKLFGSVEALKVAQSLTGAQSEKFGEILDQLGDKSLTAANFLNALEEKQNTSEQVSARFWGTIDRLVTIIGEQLAPAFNKITLGLTEVADEFANNDQAVKDFGTVLVSVVEGSSFILKNLVYTIGWTGKAINALGVIFEAVGTVISENINLMIAAFDQFAASSLRAMASTIEHAQKLADVLPYVEDSFQTSIDAINAKADEYQRKSIERADRARQFFIISEEEKNAALEVFQENELQARSAHAEKLSAIDLELSEKRIAEEEARYQEELALKEARRAAALELQDEENQEDAERLQAKLDREQEQRQNAMLREALEDFKAKQKKRKDQEKEVKDFENDQRRKVDAAFQAGQQIFKDNTVVGKALFLAEKARQIAHIINSGRQAATLARATIPPPAGEAAAAREILFAGLQAAAVAASSFSAQTGGKVPGGANGDKPFGFLEGGEIIIPSRLAPTFEQLYGNFPRASTQAAQTAQSAPSHVHVTVGFDDEASRYLTLRQYEDVRLGISR